jgi:integrase
VPLFSEWFNGRFWEEWVIARKNKPSEVEAKRAIFNFHLRPAFGDVQLDAIDDERVAQFRAKLVKSGLSEKCINNILAVLSKALHYARRVRLIDTVPEIGLFKVEWPEPEFLAFDEYARLVEAAQEDHEREWVIAIALACEAGLRIGEIKALRWIDVDLVAGTITVAQQVRHGSIGTPKGRTRRTVPMTSSLRALLKSVRKRGVYVLGGDVFKRDQQPRSAMTRISKRAGLPDRGWHVLRHTFGTHAAMFGVNPWRLQAWLGHKRIDETLGYVHVADAHRRDLPAAVLEAATAEVDPDRRVLAQLGARCTLVAPPTSVTRIAE